ncbi:MAG TPA: S8 family serine peptidase [Acidimicrobiales bacterium]
MKPWRARALLVVVLVALLGAGFPAGAAEDLTISTVNDAAPGSGLTVKTGNPITVTGTSGPAAPTVSVDAGNSAFVEVGATTRLAGSAAGGAAPYTFSWSTPAGALRDAAGPAVTFDATGVTPGVIDVTLTATDSGGRVGSDTVKVSVYELSRTTLASETGDTLVGVPDEIFPEAGGNIDGQSTEVRFTVPAGSRDLQVTLDWGIAENDFDLYAWGEGVTGDTTAASGSKPEILTEPEPVNGYVAKVGAFATVPDSWELTATALTPPADPRPSLLVPNPLRFEVGEPQTLRADVAGGTSSYAVAWDLDGNGTYEAPGKSVTTDFALGTHLVTAKVVDSAGFEARETVPVRVVPPGSQLGSSPYVVIAINDTGINPYHRDYSAATYPDRSILEATAGFTRHPSEYLPGYPVDAEALPVTLGKGFLPPEDCPDITTAPTTGDSTAGYTIEATCAGGLWNPARIEGGKLYWIPGTKIIGAHSFIPDAHPILDDNGHGTGASSVSAGNTYGSCPACLIVFDEGFGSDWTATQPWIDFVSNSYGNINLTPDLPVNAVLNEIDVKDAVERGQTWLFASGNGHGNAFTIPNTSYTQPRDAADWIVRVGAIDSGNRQPVIGDGMPADVSSFGTGPLPSADPISDSAVDSFGGTSAATPITSGVFGLVLAAARDALGDDRAGQRPGSAIAVGRPVAGSPYLGDGVLTRAEIWELVFKTAMPGEYPDTDVVLSNATYPLDQLHYLFEGYGIADEASAAYAVDVMMGRAPLPDRAEEDAFFAKDSALRVELYGTWKGYQEQYGGDASLVSAFAGVTPADVDTIDEALSVLGDAGALVPSPATSTAPSSSTATVGSEGSDAVSGLPLLANPKTGATYDATKVRDVAAAGNAGTRAGTETIRRYPRRAGAAGDCTGKEYLSPEPAGADPECAFTAQTISYVGPWVAGEFENSYALEAPLPITLDAHRPVSGTIYLHAGNQGTGNTPNPDTVMLVTLRSNGAIVGWQRISKPVTQGAAVPFDFSFGIEPRFASVPLDKLELVVGLRRTSGAARESLSDPSSFVDLPLAPTSGRAVKLTIDGADAGTYPIDERDGTWGTNLDLNTISTGSHTITATVLTDGVAGVSQSSTFRVVRPLLARVVEVTLLRPDGSNTGWTAGRFDAAGSAWTARIKSAPAPGEYRLVARVTKGGKEIGRSAPVPMTVSAR